MRIVLLAALSPLALAIAGCGGEGGASGSIIPPAAAAPTPTPSPTPTPPPVVDPDAPCVAGTWTAVDPDPNDAVNSKLPLKKESAHFAVHYLDGVATDAQVNTALESLEYIWSHFMGKLGFPEPDCTSATKRKANLFIGQGYGLSGGLDGRGNMGMWIGPGGSGDRFGLAHELTHALQGSTGGLQDSPFTGWMWESHANFMATQLPEFRDITHCSVFTVNYPHLYYGSTRMRYCGFQFFEYLKNRYGYKSVSDILARAPKRGDPAQATADPMEVLMKNQGWSLEQLNNVFGDWALHNINWDYIDPDGTDHGAVFRRDYGGWQPQTDERLLRSTILEPIDLANRRFAVPADWAPQRWGYNVVKLHPDRGASEVTVAFRGVVQNAPAVTSLPGLADEPSTIAAPDSGWRWGVVAIGADGKSRRSALQNGEDGSLTVPVRSDDKELYMVVLAAPKSFHHIRWDQPYYSIYRFPWMAQFTGAMPANYQPDYRDPAGGRRHANGGGWVSRDADVDASAYIGPYARVFSGQVRGNARIEDHAIVWSGTVQDNARVSALSVIRGNSVVKDNARIATVFLGLGEYEKDIVISGTAQIRGDAEQRGASPDKGVYYGFIDQFLIKEANRGANLTEAVPEVTARPNYVWP